MAEATKETAASTASTVKDALTSDPPPQTDAYIPWDAPGVEDVKPGEEEKARQIAETMNRMQKHNFNRHRHAFRATHVKTQGIVKGTLAVLPHIPPHLRQGMFTEPGKSYDVAARYANEPVFLQPDQTPGPRGLSMKVFEVHGDRADPDDKSTTQDFMFNNAPMIELTDIDTCLDIMKLREKYFDTPTQLKAMTAARLDAMKQLAPGMLPNTNMIGMEFYTQSAFRFGEYYGHIGLFPVLDEMKAKEAETVGGKHGHEVLSEWLQDYFAHAGAKYDMKIQLGTSLSHHPTEDASVVWCENSAPYQTIATITFPAGQDPMLPERRVFWEEKMSLSPWNCLDAHRPLGSINRLRKIVYAHSKKKREALNASRGGDVQSISEIP